MNHLDTREDCIHNSHLGNRISNYHAIHAANMERWRLNISGREMCAKSWYIIFVKRKRWMTKVVLALRRGAYALPPTLSLTPFWMYYSLNFVRGWNMESWCAYLRPRVETIISTMTRPPGGLAVVDFTRRK